MDSARADEILRAARASVTSGNGRLNGTGFWALVSAVKRDPSLRASYARPIAEVDRAAFERWALLRVGLGAGTLVMVLATLAALGIIAAAYFVDSPWNGILLLLGTGGLLVTTHGLAHLAVGAAAGIRFTDWFIASILQPQPGVKIDYESYLAAPPAARARMHAAGAVVTKAMPFLLLGVAWGMGAPAWTWVVLVVVGLATILTDILWSVQSSDWKKYRRERSYA